MKILHVMRRLQKSAGTSTFCVEVCNGLVSAGHEVSIATCYPDDQNNFALHPAVRVVHVASCVSRRSDDLPDVVHIHALWSPFLRVVANWAYKLGIPIVWSTHGLTAPWAMHHKWWKKMPIWWLYQKRHLKRARLVHATTELEAEWNAQLGVKNNVIVPLGTHEKPSPCERIAHRLLFVGRLYPVKGLENLIRAWAQVDTGYRNAWKLRLVGPDQDGYRGKLELLVEKLKLNDSVEFPGPKFNNELSFEYDACDCLVLPSFTENFGAIVVDALAHGKPCITSMFTPWKELEERGCGWWVSNEPTILARTIESMIRMGDEQRCEMGLCGRRLVEEKYTWSAVVKAMERAYESVLCYVR